MRRQRWWLPLVALVFVTSWKSTLTLPVPDEELDTSTKLLGSSVVTSVSVVTGSSDHVAVDNSVKTSTADRMRVIPSKEMPASPADLMRPDKFQFYTLNKDGNVVTKQMTEEEIKTLIAAGGGHMPTDTAWSHEPQSAGDVFNGETGVADVVHNVQNVLKGELNKPAAVMTSVPTIPGHANTEWSSILPAILGLESETAPVNEQPSSPAFNGFETPIVADTTFVKIPEAPVIPTTTTKLPVKETEPSPTMGHESVKRPSGVLETENHAEKPMIQVPVITVDQKLPSHLAEEDSIPVFQMLNTISADKINAKNNTQVVDKPKPVQGQLGNLPVQKETPNKPETPLAKPDSSKDNIAHGTTVSTEKLPEMIQLNVNSGSANPSPISQVKDQTLKPESGIITSDTVSKKPESEPSASMTVISETHSTSVKVSDHEEIPLSKPSQPIGELTDRVQASAETSKPEKSTDEAISTTELRLDTTTPRAQAIKKKPAETTTEQSFFAQGVSFFGNLPQTVSSIVSDFISNNSPSSTPIVEEADVKIPSKISENITAPVQATYVLKTPEVIKTPAAQTTSPVQEPAPSTKKPANQEPVYQLMPEITPGNKISSHGTSLSEASSIEHIIETLNDSTGSVSSTVNDFVANKLPENKLNVSKVEDKQPDPQKTSEILDTQTSTTATKLNPANPVKSTSAKPMEPLSTELADSLTSMISQISDTMPSVLPISESVGLDTTEKKNVVNVSAEEPGNPDDAKTQETMDVAKISEVPVDQVTLPVTAEPEKSVDVSTEKPVIQSFVSTTDVKASIENVKDSSSTELPVVIEVTTESRNIDSSSTVKSAVASDNNEKLKVSNENAQPVIEKLEVPKPKPEKTKPEKDEEQASSDITTDKVVSPIIIQEPVKTENIKEPATTAEPLVEEISTYKTTITSSPASITSTIKPMKPLVYSTIKPMKPLADSTIKPIEPVANPTIKPMKPVTDPTSKPFEVQTDSSVTVPESVQSEDQKKEATIEKDTTKDNTEPPIVRIDIMESKPTEYYMMNDSQPTKNVNDVGESPLVRIKLTDPIEQINNMIASANTDATPSPVEPLSLPETESRPPNTIASGLIAGYPSSTTQATTSAILNLEATTTIDPVKFIPDVQILSDAPANNVAANVKATDVKASEVKNNTNSETSNVLATTKQDSVTDKIEITKAPLSTDTTTTASKISADITDTSKKPVLAESSNKATTIAADTLAQTSTNKPTIKETIAESSTSKSAEIKGSTTLVPTQTIHKHEYAPTKMVENVTMVIQEPTTTKSALPMEEASEKPIQSSASTTSEQSESSGKLKENSKIVEKSTTGPLKSEMTTALPESPEMKIKTPEVPAELINSTKSGVSDWHVDLPVIKTPEITSSNIESTHVPTAEPTSVPHDSSKNEGINTFQTTQNAQTITPMQDPIESSKDNFNESSNVSLQTTTLSSVEKNTATVKENTKTTTEPSKEKLKLENDAKNHEKEETNGESTMSKIGVVPSTSSSIPQETQETQEIRIQVNDTAVRVTKRPVSEHPNQKLDDTVKSSTPEEKLTTPKVAAVTEVNNVELAEKIQLPVPAKVSELSSGTETRIRLGDEEKEKVKEDITSVKVDDPRKPIKKDTDGDSLPLKEKDTLSDSSTKPPLSTNEKISVNLEKDSNAQSSTKVEITTTASSKEPSKISKPVEVEEKTTRTPEKETSTRIVTERPIAKPVKPAHKPTMSIKKDDAPLRPADDQWTLIPQQVYPALTKKGPAHGKRPITTEVPFTNSATIDQKNTSPERAPVSLDHPQSASGLDSTVNNLETDIGYFVTLCNELAFSFWTATNKGLSTARSLAVSPFGMTSMLAMVFLGARGPTSDQMNDILKLDDVASFNPHLVFQNVTDAVSLARNQGIANAAFVREIFADKSKVRKLMPFYKEQAQQFYDGVVAEVNFATISDLVRRRTNLMIRKQTGGRIKDFVRTNTVPLRSPLAALSANVFQTNCNSSAASSEGRDGELYFAVSPAVRQRKLVPVPSTVWRAGVLAGYEPGLDATAIALGGTDKLVSTIFVIPGQQGHTAPGDNLDRLEQRLIKGATHDGSWNKLLKVLIPRPGLELQVPKFSHRSVINATAALKRMGLEELFSKHADLKGINGVATDLHLADVLQMNLFSTCGDENIINGRHHVEVYPGSPLRNARGYVEFEEENDEPLEDYSINDKESFEGSALEYVPHRETRSARQNDGTEKQRLKLDRPFLYFVRHNPTGLILHMGRFNPRLMP